MSIDDSLNNHDRNSDGLTNSGPTNSDDHEELVISGLIYLDLARDIAIEVRRGMDILTSDGQTAGKVAAVIVDRQDRQVTHIVLGRLNLVPVLEYRRVPIDLIAQVHEERIRLRIVDEVVGSLSPWHGT